MGRFINLLERFRRDDRGVFAVIFGLIAIVLIAMAGAVVDFTSIQQSRTRAQTALDSAALALQPRIKLDNIATLKTKAQAIVTQEIGDSSVTATLQDPVVNTAEGTLELKAQIVRGTTFVRLVGVTSLTAQLISQATRKQLDLEVTMVLDNSISMNSNSRMTNLKLAARCATDVLFNGTTDCSTTAKLDAADALSPTNTNVKIAVVPFTEFVNVGTANKTATWMDQTGTAKVTRDNFDNDDNDSNTFATNVNRFTLYTNIGVTWSGCVEARNHTTGAGGLYYDTSDLTPDSGTPDSLFTPIFAPDQPDSGTYSNDYLNDRPTACTNKDQGSWVQTSSKTNCTANGNNNATNYNNCGTTATVTRVQKDQNGNTVTAAATEPATINGQPKKCTDTYTSVKTQTNPTNKWTNTYTRSCSYTFSDRELQERLCKYAVGNTPSIGSYFQAGPNADCGVALLPLTATKSSVISKIAAMGPDGATDIQQGVMWGFHTISPTAPFTEGKAYDAATSKVMIVMTDGENTAGMTDINTTISRWEGNDWYLAWGYPYSGRITGSTINALQVEMNARTSTTCENVKAKGIIVYTIGLAVDETTDPDAVTTMLTNCASGSDHAYFPAAASDLVDTFKTIAGQLADLRLAK